jgi:hypothetical protein
VHRYLETLIRIFARVVGRTTEHPGVVAPHGNSDELYAVGPTEDDDEAA